MESIKNKGKRILLLGVYGMEMVECGGVLHKNAMYCIFMEAEM